MRTTGLNGGYEGDSGIDPTRLCWRNVEHVAMGQPGQQIPAEDDERDDCPLNAALAAFGHTSRAPQSVSRPSLRSRARPVRPCAPVYKWRGAFDDAWVNRLHAEGFEHRLLDIDWRTQVESHSFGMGVRPLQDHPSRWGQAQRREADRRLASGWRAPLLGVPSAVKDDTDVTATASGRVCERGLGRWHARPNPRHGRGGLGLLRIAEIPHF